MAELTKRQEYAVQDHVTMNHLRSDGYLHCIDCKRIKCSLRDMIQDIQDDPDTVSEKCIYFVPKRFKLADYLAYLKYGGFRALKSSLSHGKAT